MNVTNKPGQFSRPAEVCKALLAALDAADGRRRKRKRDQTPDGIGLAIKRVCSRARCKTIRTRKPSRNGCSNALWRARRNRPEPYPPWPALFLKSGALRTRSMSSKIGWMRARHRPMPTRESANTTTLIKANGND